VVIQAFAMLCGANTIEEIQLDESTISRLHAAPGKVVIAVTGGGSTAVARLLAVPGASGTLIEATVPYDVDALADYLGGSPDQACSGKTARALAMVAFQRARRFEQNGQPLFGIGCTAALVTDRARRGGDRCYVAVQSLTETREYSLTLSREGRDRSSQESMCADLILAAIATAFALGSIEPVLMASETLSCIFETADPAWQELFSGRLALTNHSVPGPALIFPGAFNPLHDGHREMVRVAEQMTGDKALLEISTFNVDKPPLDYVDMRLRERGLHAEFPFTFTNAPTFVEKSELFPGATFMVGSDTLERIGQPRYYHGSLELRDKALEALAGNRVRFLVFGRLTDDTFKGLDDLEIPPVLRKMSAGVPESGFRVDISSTGIRKDRA